MDRRWDKGVVPARSAERQISPDPAAGGVMSRPTAYGANVGGSGQAVFGCGSALAAVRGMGEAVPVATASKTGYAH